MQILFGSHRGLIIENLELIPKEEVPTPILLWRRRLWPYVPCLKFFPTSHPTPPHPCKFVKTVCSTMCGMNEVSMDYGRKLTYLLRIQKHSFGLHSLSNVQLKHSFGSQLSSSHLTQIEKSVPLSPGTGSCCVLGSTAVDAFPDLCHLRVKAEMDSETVCCNCTLDNGQS